MNQLNNENQTDTSTINDLCQKNISNEIYWDGLTHDQQLAVCSLFPTGYSLICTRKVNHRFLAIMGHQQEIITIDYLGNTMQR